MSKAVLTSEGGTEYPGYTERRIARLESDRLVLSEPHQRQIMKPREPQRGGATECEISPLSKRHSTAHPIAPCAWTSHLCRGPIARNFVRELGNQQQYVV
jgi:hypothetical protein